SDLKGPQNHRSQNNPQNPQSRLRNPSRTRHPTLRTRSRTRTPRPRRRPRRRTCHTSRRSRILLIITKHIPKARPVICKTFRKVADGLLLRETVEAAVAICFLDGGGRAAFVHNGGGIVVV